ncbi:hypothetical protein [Campylobacter sp. MIT 97-5078]|uniref:hypothetical protein n=1 Tax=Campylobacter sp. MIT 97-5078 TaxID=1548153 RepID=UPI0005135090|nr:hypothetical protein [Campylobacter sp. MIT 97-5078]KGI56173.1 hypothetical protein LR59_08365 [Campylobacter sp. MIT 97-5078]TQR25541.1 hypothetical protein DMB91_07685 [Campylobacter sp. MIT 97-5078]
MVRLFAKVLILGVLLGTKVFAISSLELAQNIIANPNLEEKLKLLFEGRDYTDENGYANLSEISRILKTNSLLSLTLASSQSLELSFKSKASNILFLKVINDALNQAGFVYFTPIQLDLSTDLSTYKLRIESRYILDPGSFYTLLKQNFVFIENVRKTGAYSYEYSLDFSRAKLSTNTNVMLNQSTKLGRPLKDYIIDLKGASTISLKASPADAWFPKIIFVDKDLKLIENLESQEKNNNFSSSIPSNAVYAIVGDSYNLDNIRRGLEIYLSK